MIIYKQIINHINYQLTFLLIVVIIITNPKIKNPTTAELIATNTNIAADKKS